MLALARDIGFDLELQHEPRCDRKSQALEVLHQGVASESGIRWGREQQRCMAAQGDVGCITGGLHGSRGLTWAQLCCSRKWRRGVKTYILMDEKLNKSRAPPGLMEGINANMEYFDYWPDPEGANVWSQPGDARWMPPHLVFGISPAPRVLRTLDEKCTSQPAPLSTGLPGPSANVCRQKHRHMHLRSARCALSKVSAAWCC